MNRFICGLAMAVLSTASAMADSDVDVLENLERDGEVRIENVAGSVTVSTWDQEKIEIKGSLGRDVKELRISGDEDGWEIEVIPERGPWNRQISSRLEFRVPEEIELDINTVSANVKIDGIKNECDVETVSGRVEVDHGAGEISAVTVSGGIRIEGVFTDVRAGTVSGSVEVDGQAEDIVAKSISGTVRIDAPAESVEAKSVSGRVEVQGAQKDARLSSVSGRLSLAADKSDTVELSTVSGSINFATKAYPEGRLDAKAQSGSIRIELPKDISAKFDVSSHTGSIRNAFGVDAVRSSNHGPGRELIFETHQGDVRIRINSFSGSVSIDN